MLCNHWLLMHYTTLTVCSLKWVWCQSLGADHMAASDCDAGHRWKLFSAELLTLLLSGLSPLLWPLSHMPAVIFNLGLPLYLLPCWERVQSTIWDAFDIQSAYSFRLIGGNGHPAWSHMAACCWPFNQGQRAQCGSVNRTVYCIVVLVCCSGKGKKSEYGFGLKYVYVGQQRNTTHIINIVQCFHNCATLNSLQFNQKQYPAEQGPSALSHARRRRTCVALYTESTREFKSIADLGWSRRGNVFISAFKKTNQSS